MMEDNQRKAMFANMKNRFAGIAIGKEGVRIIPETTEEALIYGMYRPELYPYREKPTGVAASLPGIEGVKTYGTYTESLEKKKAYDKLLKRMKKEGEDDLMSVIVDARDPSERATIKSKKALERIGYKVGRRGELLPGKTVLPESITERQVLLQPEMIGAREALRKESAKELRKIEREGMTEE